MTLESSDINDREIIDATKQIRTDKGFLQFKYICEDGHEIKSEEFNPDHARRALMAWCNVVRETLVARAEEQAASKRRAKMVIPEDEGFPVVEPVKPITRKPKIEIVEPTEREEYCSLTPGEVLAVKALEFRRPKDDELLSRRRPDVCELRSEQKVKKVQAAFEDDAAAFVQAKINYHFEQMQKWQRIQGAM